MESPTGDLSTLEISDYLDTERVSDGEKTERYSKEMSKMTTTISKNKNKGRGDQEGGEGGPWPSFS